MKVSDLLNLGFKPISVPDENREIKGCYIGDLLSWVMGKAQEGDAWITIMSNQNILAVASLIQVSCIILAENVGLDENIITLAKEKKITVLSGELPAYEIAKILSRNGI